MSREGRKKSREGLDNQLKYDNMETMKNGEQDEWAFVGEVEGHGIISRAQQLRRICVLPSCGVSISGWQLSICTDQPVPDRVCGSKLISELESA
jgi:hypothetical protein